MKNCDLDPTPNLKRIVDKWGKLDSIPKFEFKKVSHGTVRKVILSLKNSNPECRKGLSNNIVKMSVDVLTHPMTHLINVILDKANFPRIWKFYKSIGIYKGKDDREELSSYRPISTLSPLFKVMEKVILIQLYEYMSTNGLFNNRSYAYKQSQSTINALMDMYETWCENIDNNQQNINIFLDMSSAFDCVSHSTLVEKMRIYNLNDGAIKLSHHICLIALGTSF